MGIQHRMAGSTSSIKESGEVSAQTIRSKRKYNDSAPDEALFLAESKVIFLFLHDFSASVAQLDARPTGDRRSLVQPPPRSATFFRGD